MGIIDPPAVSEYRTVTGVIIRASAYLTYSVHVYLLGI